MRNGSKRIGAVARLSWVFLSGLLGPLAPAWAIDFRITPVAGLGSTLNVPANTLPFLVSENGWVLADSFGNGAGFRLITDTAGAGILTGATDAYPGANSTAFTDSYIFFQTIGTGIPVPFRLSRVVDNGAISGITPVYYNNVVSWTHANSAGLAVAIQQGTRAFRVNGDGTTTDLAVETAQIDPVWSRPRIVTDGTIYIGASFADRHEIWKFAPGVTTSHAVAYSAPVTDSQISAWDVNDKGALVVARRAPNGSSASLVTISPDGSVRRTVMGSQLAGANYRSAFINLSGMVAALLDLPGKTQAVYAVDGGALEPVISTGDAFGVGVIRAINPSSVSINSLGQQTLFLQVTTAAGVSESIVRIDLRGDKDFPVPPSPCPTFIERGFCFGDDPLAPIPGVAVPPLGPARRIYFDPEVAIGYEYIARANAFAGVEIPFAYGNGSFDLYLWDAANNRYVSSGVQVQTGKYLAFSQLGAANGVSRFALMGIEPEAAVDPADPLGFVTGLTFTSSDIKTKFTMIPVVSSLPAGNWPFVGFYSPVDNPPVVNGVKGGQGIPVKFSLGANRGLDIFQPGYPASQTIGCDTLSGTVDPLITADSAGDSGLQYDAATDVYTYVWKTSSTWARTCRVLTLRMKDGSRHDLNFKFK